MGGERMGAADLTRPAAPRDGAERALASGWLRAYAAAWALTAAAAAAVVAGGAGIEAAARRSLALSFSPAAPSAWHAIALWAHNLPIAAWPMLLGPLGARSRRGRSAADALVAASLAANTLPVGAAIAAYGARLLPYMPQLPIEWAALACGPAWRIAARRQQLDARTGALWLVITGALMFASALIETCLAGRA
jgi:hypothetical protein